MEALESVHGVGTGSRSQGLTFLFVAGLSLPSTPAQASPGNNRLQWLMDSFPSADLTVFHESMCSNVSLWKHVETRGERLMEYLNRLEWSTLPLVFLCHGLGGFIALKAMDLLGQLDRNALKLDVRNVTSAATAELDKKNVKKSTDDDLENLALLVDQLKKPFGEHLQIISVAEGTREKHGFRRSLPGLGEKAVVGPAMAKLDEAHCLIVQEGHHMNILELSGENREIIVQKIRQGLDAFRPEDAPVAMTRGKRTYSNTGKTKKPQSQQIEPKGLHLIDLKPDRYFARREKILKILWDNLVVRAESSSLPTPRQFVLYGPRGFGKTQIARQFAKEAENHFHHILWVRADQSTQIIRTFSKFAEMCGLRGANGDADVDRLRTVLRDLDKPFLVIFDNALDENLINDWMPDGDMASVLITTVDQVFATSNVAGHGTPVEAMSAEEAMEMVTNHLHPPTACSDTEEGREDIRELVRRTSCWPLALASCIGLINRMGIALAEYNKHYDKNAILDDMGDVVQNFLKGLDEDSCALIDVFSLLYSRIPKSLFILEAGDSWSRDLKDVGFLSKFFECLTELKKGLMLHEGGSPMLDMHDLIHDVLRKRLTGSSRQSAFDTTSHLLEHALNPDRHPEDIPDRVVTRNQFLDYHSHIESLTKYYGEFSQELQVPASFVALLASSSWLCYGNGAFTSGLDHIEEANKILDADKSGTRELTRVPSRAYVVNVELELLHNHACIATEIGDFKTSLHKFEERKSMLENAIEKGIAIKDENGKWEVIWGGIANSHQGLGDQESAIECYKKCLGYGSRNDIHSPYEVNICRSYWAQDANNKASERLEELIQLRENRYGPDDKEDYIIGHMKFVLGNVRINQGRLDEAFTLHRSTLECWRHTFGESHHKTGDAYHKVGWHYARIEQWADAERELCAALQIYESSMEERFRKGEIARTNYKLAQVYRSWEQQENYRKALEKAEKYRKEKLKELGGSDGTSDSGMSGDNDEASYDQLVSLWAR